MTTTEYYIQKYSSKGVILDTNLLILYLVGSYDKNNIKKFKRTHSFEIEDFKFIASLLKFFRNIVVTPQILAEISNFTFEETTPDFSSYFTNAINWLQKTNEKYFHKNDLLPIPCLANIGFTDLTIIEASKNKRLLVLTDDGSLCSFLTSFDCDFINLNHIRGERWKK